MDRKALLQIFDREQRIEITSPNVRKEVVGNVIRHIINDEHFGFIPYSALEESSANAEIDAQVAYFRSLKMSFEWKVYDHDRPADLRQRLAARGFEVEEPEALMVLETVPEEFWTKELPPIQRITGAEGVEAVRCMEEEIWGTDHSWMNQRLTGDLERHPDLLSVFAVPADGRVVSAAWIYYHPPTRFASLWGGSTLPAYRGRGCYSALLAVRAREARERGFRFLTVDASPMSRPILEKHGFQFLGYSTPCKWNPPMDTPDGGENG